MALSNKSKLCIDLMYGRSWTVGSVMDRPNEADGSDKSKLVIQFST